MLLQSRAYKAPEWVQKALTNVPPTRIALGHFPTPIFRFKAPDLPPQFELYIKRDDYSGVETSGNKARKLEFLLADALKKKADCIVTCGGIQSNHCRATAVAAKMLGLESYLLLRTNDPKEEHGLVGNLLLDRMVDANLILMSKQEYAKYGSNAMIQKVCQDLRAKGRNPYPIPVGGSNGLGTWGYIEAINEIQTQCSKENLDITFTDLAFACGSGSTATGLALGAYLNSKYATAKEPFKPQSFAYNKNARTRSSGIDNRTNDGVIPIHAYHVCDKESYFTTIMDEVIMPEMGLDTQLNIQANHLLQFTNAQGIGYAKSTLKELQFIQNVATQTGVLLDPVYSGKALYHLMQDLQHKPQNFAGNKILFVHTGGLFGLYDKSNELMELMNENKVTHFTM